MIPPLDPIVAVLNVARSLRWVEERGENRGQAVEAILCRVGLPPGSPWCAAFVAYVGRSVLASFWPLPNVGGCSSLAEAAISRGLLHDTVRVGDVFVLHNGMRFHHTGFVVGINDDGTCSTIEGNTNAGGSPEGTGVFERTRTFKKADRFIRWAEAKL